jgi:adenosine kinase
MKKYGSLIIAGSLSWDTIMDFPGRFVDHLAPEKLHQINVSFVVGNLERQMGGTATNIAYAASQTANAVKFKILNSKFEIPIVILGGLGKDGGEHLRFFRKNNIDTRGIVVDKTVFSANGSVITDTKDNQIWGFYYGACQRGKDADFSTYARKDSLMIISANHPDAFLAAQQYAVRNGVDYLYDAGMTLTWITDRDLKQGVLNAAFLIGNDYEIAMIMKRIRMTEKKLAEKGIGVVTTLGEKGVAFEGKNIVIPAVKVRKVVDPTGAGDGFRGGFMIALACGYDIIDCLKVGSAVASFAVERYGTVNYQITKREFDNRLKELNRKSYET